MDRMLAQLFAAAVAMALSLPHAAADGESLSGGQLVAPYRTHALSPGPEYGRDAGDPCRRLAAARWAGDYVAGVSAYGRPVAPANLDSGRPDGTAPIVSFDIPVSRSHGPVRHRGMTAGTVTVDTATGLVDLDGRFLDPSETARLRELCLGR